MKVKTEKSIIQKVKTFEQACEMLNISPKSLPIVSNIDKKLRNYILAQYKLIIITQALNEGWKPNWGDHNQLKYSVWHTIKTDGTGFDYSDCYRWDYLSVVPSRLLYKSSELALYSGRQFKKLWKDYILISK